MKPRIKTLFIILPILLANRTLAQNKLNTQKTTNMENKETLEKLYEEVLNNHRFELLDIIISSVIMGAKHPLFALFKKFKFFLYPELYPCNIFIYSILQN
jgi:hypothetical protein